LVLTAVFIPCAFTTGIPAIFYRHSPHIAPRGDLGIQLADPQPALSALLLKPG